MARSKRKALIEALGAAGRELSAHTVMFHTAVAARMGLSASEHKAFDLILRRGAVTAGELAAITGLTTGAVTGLIDRLEGAGFVERNRDEADRRKVLVRVALSPARQRGFEALFGSLRDAVAKSADSYSERELAVILDFLRRSAEMLHAETLKLTGGTQE